MSISKYLKKEFKIYDGADISEFIRKEIEDIEQGKKILDLGAGTQPYRKYCNHLQYYTQDFGQANSGLGTDKSKFNYGKIDYLGNCWSVEEADETFDAIICTEVLEHIPYPEETIKEISRLLKKNGRLILTVPENSLRHMEPFWFQPGLSDNWIRHFFEKYGLKLDKLQSVGDYSTYILNEIYRSLAYHKWAFVFLVPGIIFFRYFFNHKIKELDGLTCLGYRVAATKQ